jgi:hypothetical protein
VDKGINTQAAPRDRLSRRKFLKDANIGLSVTLSGMKAFDEPAAANTGPDDSDTRGETSSPIQVYRDNPHYYLFRGKPTILITSAEHYGAVVNLDFDYVTYLNALKEYGLNYTREWPGAVLEVVGEFIKDNTMGPRPRRTIVPWARSNEPSCVYWGNKFDLDKWNPEYFARLKDFIAKADERDIVVEISFFNSQYTHRWPRSPLYYENNIQGVGKCDFEDAQTLKYLDLVQRESA